MLNSQPFSNSFDLLKITCLSHNSICLNFKLERRNGLIRKEPRHWLLPNEYFNSNNCLRASLGLILLSPSLSPVSPCWVTNGKHTLLSQNWCQGPLHCLYNQYFSCCCWSIITSYWIHNQYLPTSRGEMVSTLPNQIANPRTIQHKSRINYYHS